MSEAIRAKFAARQTTEPARGSRDAVSFFIAAAKAQAAKALAEKANGRDPNKAATNWFKPNGSGYVLFFGKNRIKLDGTAHWEAKDLDEVAELLNDAATLAKTDGEFQKAIRTAKPAGSKVTTATKTRAARGSKTKTTA